MKDKNGGQAFPKSGYAPVGNGSNDGMTLRDYFAAKALAGRCALLGAFDETYEAEVCYKLADAMLAERAK